MKQRFPVPYIAWLIYLLPFAAAAGMVAYYGVNVPVSDQWSLPGLFANVAAHRGVLSELLRCTVHPLFFPKLIWIGLAFATKWDVRADMFVTLLSVLPILIVCARLAAKENSAAGWPVKAAIFVSSLLLFSFVHYDTFLWGFELSFTLVNAAVVWAIYLACTSQAHPVRGLVLAWACCVAASFSSLQGMMSWIVILPCLPVLFSANRRRAAGACGTVLLGAASVAVYFLAFHPAKGVGEPAFWRQHPATAAGYLMGVLGMPVSPGNSTMAQRIAWPMGAAVLILFGAGVWGMRARWRAAAPWFSIGLFSIGFATLTALGRSYNGISSAATASQYFSVSVLLTIAGLHLSRQALSGRKSSRVLFLGLAALIGVCATWRSVSSLSSVSDLKQGRERAADCLKVFNYMDPMTDNHWQGCLFRSFIPVEEWAHLTRMPIQMLEPLGWHKSVADVRFVEEPAASEGWVDSGPDSGKPLVVGPDDWIPCSGRVTAPSKGRRPRFVLFAVGDRRRFIYAATVQSSSSWAELVPAKLLPVGASELVAWAYDDQRQAFVRLRGSKPFVRLGPLNSAQPVAASVPEHPAFLGGEVALGNGDYSLRLPNGKMFGYYSYWFSNTVIYHFDMGIEAVWPAPEGAVYFSDVTSGHLWYTKPDLFPTIWDCALKTWILYLPDAHDPGRYSANPRYFENLATHAVFTM